MITLKVSSCREFQKRASQIQTNTILPILANLRLELNNGLCTITKNSLTATCIGQVEATGDDGVFLIDEKIFFTIIGLTKEETIQTQPGLLTYGQNKISFSEEGPSAFPKSPDTPEISEVIDEIEDMLFNNISKEKINEYLKETITFENIHEFI